MPDSAAKGSIALSALLLFIVPATAEGLGDKFDVAFGLSATSDYVYAGVSQSGGKPALQGYVEGDYGIFYAGVWASNVDFGEEPDVEFDLYTGIRPEFGKLSFDLGYVYYAYAGGSASNYGALYGYASVAATDDLTIGGNVNVAPDYSQMGDGALWLQATAEYALPADFALSGGLGWQGYAESLALPDYWTWSAGVSWTWQETLAVGLTYSGSDLDRTECAAIMTRNACGHRLMATVSVDTAASSLFGN